MSKDAVNPYWWLADDEQIHHLVFEYAEALETERQPYLERMLWNAKLYDGRGDLLSARSDRHSVEPYAYSTENVVKSTVDTATAIIAKNRPRAAFETDGAEWSVQRRAKHLERYVEGLFHKADVYEKCQEIFRDALIFGTGFGKIVEEDGYPCVERVMPDEILVDEYECRSSLVPRQMHQRTAVDKDVLKGFLKRRGLLDESVELSIDNCDVEDENRVWGGYKGLEDNQCILIESWVRTAGKVKGKHALSIRNRTLMCEDWSEDEFPFVTFRWTKPLAGFYGISFVEEIAGIQLRIHKMNKFIDRCQDNVSVPRVFMHVSDAQMRTTLNETIGQIAFYRSKPPIFSTPPAVSADYYQRLEQLKQSAYELTGVSRMQANAMKPAGLESAVAIREYNDINSDRFAIQAQNYESMHLEIARKFVRLAKKLHTADKRDMKLFWKSGNLAKKISWPDVDMDEEIFTMSIEAASIMSRTPAGRQQQVVELMQAGLVSVDEGRRMLGHPDIKAEMDMATAAIEDIHASIEHHLDGGEYEPPEDYQNLALGVKLYQQAILRYRREGCPQKILDNLQLWMAQADSKIKLLQAAAQPAMEQPQAAPAPAMSEQAMTLKPSWNG